MSIPVPSRNLPSNSRPRVRAALGLVAVLAMGSGCGAAADTTASAPTPVRPAAPEVPCPKIVCDPDHDYGQPSLASLREARSRMTTTSVPSAAGGSGTAAAVLAAIAAAGSGTAFTVERSSKSRTVTTESIEVPVVPGPAGARGPAGPPSPDFASVYTRWRGSIADFRVRDCRSGEPTSGSGFLVAPDYVVTAAHVVEDGAIRRLSVGGQDVSGRTVGIDSRQDVALVKLTKPVAASPIPLATGWPAVGSPLAVMGHAQGGPVSMQQGNVSAVDVTFDGIGGWLMTDTAEDHGSSGGPVLDAQGRAVGIVSTSIGEAGLVHLEAGSQVAAKLIANWKVRPQSLPQTC